MKLVRNYCHVCGGKLRPDSFKSWWCDNCDQDYYANPAPCVELALFNEAGEIAICTRAQEPAKGKLDLPGGFIDLGDTAEAALFRELEEELGLKPHDMSTPEYVTSYTTDYPWGKETYQLVVLVFKAQLTSGATLQAQDDVAEVTFMDSATVPAGKLAVPDFYPQLFARLRNETDKT